MARHVVKSPVTGTVWMHSVGIGQKVFEGNPIAILESMKMEIPLEAPIDGEVVELAPAGQVINEGDVVAVIEG